MQRLLIYSSPVDHHNPADWYRYRDRVRGLLGDASAASSVTVDDAPLFTYGVHVDSVIARINAVRPRPNEIVLAHWSTIVFYSASVFFLGDDVDARAVRTALSGEPFLKEHVGTYGLANGSCYAYQLYPYEEPDISLTRRLVDRVPGRVYVGSLGLVASEDMFDEEPTGEKWVAEWDVDERRFEVLRQRPPTRPGYWDGKAVFRPRSAEIEVEAWDRGARDEGLAVLSENDPRIAAVLEQPSYTGNELTLFMGADAGPRLPRVTIQRCHMDDTIVCLYNDAYVEGPRLQFLV